MSLHVDICKKLGSFTLRVQFETSQGVLGVLGTSGSGKSMALKCIAGVETPDEGTIVLNDKVLFDAGRKINLKPQERQVGYLFQNYALFPHMTVEENICCSLQAKWKSENKKLAMDLLERFGLGGLEKRFPRQLSGGQQQRVALARILASSPKALLLDEPFSALDTHLKENMQLEMQEVLAQYTGQTVLVTHSRDEAYRLCGRLLVLEEGTGGEQGDTHAMFDCPQKLQTARITGCKNISRARKLGPGEVEALDWGLTLKTREEIPERLTHVGIRAHDFATQPGEGQTNQLSVFPVEVVEAPFEWTVLFTSRKEGAVQPIWWKHPKMGAEAKVPDRLYCAPDKILLLEE